MGSTTRRRRRRAQAVDDDLDGETQKRIGRKALGATRERRAAVGVADLGQRFDRGGADIGLGSVSSSAHSQRVPRRPQRRARDRRQAGARPDPDRPAAPASAAATRPAWRAERPGRRCACWRRRAQIGQHDLRAFEGADSRQRGEDRLAHPRIALWASASPRAGTAAGSRAARAAAQRSSADALAKRREAPGAGSRCLSALCGSAAWRGVSFLSCSAISGSGSTQVAPPASTSSPGMPQTTAVSSASAIVRPPNARSRVMDAAPSLPMPVISTPIRGWAEHAPWRSRTNRSALGCQGRGVGRRRRRDQAAGEPRNDDIGVAAPDIGAARFEHRRPRHLADADRAEAVQAARQRAGETRRHVLGDDDRPGKRRRQAPSSASSAGGPPVEVPTSTMPSPVARHGRFAAAHRVPARGTLPPMRC